MRAARRDLNDALERARQIATSRHLRGSASRSPGGCPYFERHVRRRVEPARPARPARRRQRSALIPTRSAFPATRRHACSRRTTSPSCCAATRATRRRRGAGVCSTTSTSSRVDEHPEWVRGRRLRGRRSLPKRMALAAGIPGADLVPETAELFLGFTSTQKAGSARRRIANFETLGYSNSARRLLPRRHAHALSHIFEDLEAWYLNFDFRERVDTTFGPGLEVRSGHADGPQGPRDTERRRRREADFRRAGGSGTAPRSRRRRACCRTTSRTTARSTSRDGDPAPRRLQHARQPVRLERGARGRRHGGRPRGRRPLRRLQPDERRLQAQPAGDGRRPARTGRGCRSRRATAGRAQLPCCGRRTGRTSSSRRAGTARSRWWSFDRRAVPIPRVARVCCRRSPPGRLPGAGLPSTTGAAAIASVQVRRGLDDRARRSSRAALRRGRRLCRRLRRGASCVLGVWRDGLPPDRDRSTSLLLRRRRRSARGLPIAVELVQAPGAALPLRRDDLTPDDPVPRSGRARPAAFKAAGHRARTRDDAA